TETHQGYDWLKRVAAKLLSNRCTA
ncbi:hypothetical protein D046_5951B, partial [Vibrio parahaemolyticus V-223/04]